MSASALRDHPERVGLRLAPLEPLGVLGREKGRAEPELREKLEGTWKSTESLYKTLYRMST